MVVPDDQFGDSEASKENLLDESTRSVICQGAREPQKHNEVEPALGEDLSFLTRRGQDGRREVRTENSQWMRLEGQEDGSGVCCVGPSPDLIENRLMP
jgi:hypothetical protein